jgi:hypothetical protein
VPSVMPDDGGNCAFSLRPPVLADPESIARLAEEACLVPANHPSSIYHPPRRPSL